MKIIFTQHARNRLKMRKIDLFKIADALQAVKYHFKKFENTQAIVQVDDSVFGILAIREENILKIITIYKVK